MLKFLLTTGFVLVAAVPLTSSARAAELPQHTCFQSVNAPEPGWDSEWVCKIGDLMRTPQGLAGQARWIQVPKGAETTNRFNSLAVWSVTDGTKAKVIHEDWGVGESMFEWSGYCVGTTATRPSGPTQTNPAIWPAGCLHGVKNISYWEFKLVDVAPKAGKYTIEYRKIR